jgi:hypothetical protein
VVALPGGVPGLSKAQAQRITEVNRKVAASKSCRCAIVAFPADQDPDVPFSIG